MAALVAVPPGIDGFDGPVTFRNGLSQLLCEVAGCLLAELDDVLSFKHRLTSEQEIICG